MAASIHQIALIHHNKELIGTCRCRCYPAQMFCDTGIVCTASLHLQTIGHGDFPEGNGESRLATLVIFAFVELLLIFLDFLVRQIIVEGGRAG